MTVPPRGPHGTRPFPSIPHHSSPVHTGGLARAKRVVKHGDCCASALETPGRASGPRGDHVLGGQDVGLLLLLTSHFLGTLSVLLDV